MDLWQWMNGLVTSYGYFGAFLVSILGNVSILIPVPFVLVIYCFGSVLNPALLGLAAGLGSTVGEFGAYLLGRGGRHFLSDKYAHRLDTVEKLIDRHGSLIIFLFALLPLPDDLLLVPLGMMKYDWHKVLIGMFAGKTLMCLVVAYAGQNSFEFVKRIYESSGLLGGAASLIALALVVFVLLKVDWEKLAFRYEAPTERSPPREP